MAIIKLGRQYIHQLFMMICINNIVFRLFVMKSKKVNNFQKWMLNSDYTRLNNHKKRKKYSKNNPVNPIFVL